MKRAVTHILFVCTLFLTAASTVYGQAFRHPGGLVSAEDIDRIKYLRGIENDPTIQAAFNKLANNNHARYTYSPNAQERVSRGDDALGDNYSIAMNDAAAAFQNALMWHITEDTRYADCAVRILNAWARTCKRITGNSNASLASGIYGYEYATTTSTTEPISGFIAMPANKQITAPAGTYYVWVRAVDNAGNKSSWII